MLVEMKAAQTLVDTTIHDISIILRPMPSLPDDVLSSIFHWCIPQPSPRSLTENRIVDSLCTALPPWSLSQVCRRWRALVLTSPILWSTLSIPLDIHTHAPEKRGSERLACHLQRSGRTELDFVLQEYHPYLWDEDDWGASDLPGFRERRNLLQLLCHTTARWSRLEIDVTGTYFEPLCDCSYPSLRQLIFSYDRDAPALPFIEHRDMDGLVELTMRTWGTMDLAWERIRTATLCSSVFEELPRMLSLEVLYVDNTFDQTDRPEPPVSCVLPNLHTIGFLSTTNILAIDFPLSSFATPALRTLELKFDKMYESDDEDSEEEQHLGSDQVRNLTHLSIEITTLSASDDILTLFHRTTNVTSLCLGWLDSGIDVLEDIGNYLLPKLTHLRLPLSRVRATPEAVIRIMEGRISSNDVAPLEEITFVRSGKEDENNTVEKLEGTSSWLRRWAELRKTIVVRYVESLN